MERAETCLITMEFGYVGVLAHNGGMTNIATSQTLSSEIRLDLDAGFGSQIYAELTRLRALAETNHNKRFPVSAGFGHILSHSVVIF